MAIEGLSVTAPPPAVQVRVSSFFRRPERLAAAFVVLVYTLIYGWVLVSSSFMPYVFDGNESYSSLVHARNLVELGPAHSFGLTDEAASPHPQAHPYIHTHQGNFPRLYATLLYVLGARSIESQIAITTFTVGLATILIAFAFFRKVVTTLFALVATLLLMTDYLLFAQWNVVTYRVWYGFFVFTSLLACHGLAGKRRRSWIGLMFLVYVGMFYFELVFATFVAIATGIYLIWLYRRDVRTILVGVGAQVAGAFTGLAVLSAQLVAVFGMSVYLEDLYLTYVARNQISGGGRFLQKLVDFYQTHHIVFWRNFSYGVSRGPRMLLESTFASTFRIHTGGLTRLALFVFAALCLAWLVHTVWPGRLVGSAGAATRYRLGAMALYLTFAVGLVLFGRTIFGPVRSPRLDLLVYSEPWKRIGSLAAFVVNVGGVLAVGVGLRLIWAGPQRLLTPTARRIGNIIPIIASGLLAYTIVYELAPGYVQTGYLARLAPFLVFHVDMLMAASLFLLLSLGLGDVRRFSSQAAIPRRSSDFARIVALGLAMSFIGYWGSMQAAYVHRFPFDRFTFMKQLRKPPFRGATFVSNTYAVPTSLFTGEWAYQDEKLGADHLLETSRGYALENDLFYLWFADRETNAAYRRPKFYLCFEPNRSIGELGQFFPERGLGGCRAVPLVQAAVQGIGPMRPRLVAADDPVHDSWAIVQLDWGPLASPRAGEIR